MQHGARNVRRGAERGISHHVDVAEARKPEGTAHAVTPGRLHIQQDLGRTRELHARINRCDERSRRLGARRQAVRTRVRYVEGGVILADDVELRGQPPNRVLGVRKNERRLFALRRSLHGLVRAGWQCRDCRAEPQANTERLRSGTVVPASLPRAMMKSFRPCQDAAASLRNFGEPVISKHAVRRAPRSLLPALAIHGETS